MHISSEWCSLYSPTLRQDIFTWWRNQMETFSAFLALCGGNPPVSGGYSSQRPETWSFDVFFDVRLNKRLSKQSRYRCFETPGRSLWRHCKETPWWRSWSGRPTSDQRNTCTYRHCRNVEGTVFSLLGTFLTSWRLPAIFLFLVIPLYS